MEHGGYFKARESDSWFDSHTPIGILGDNPLWDGSSEFLYKGEVFTGDSFSFKLHYEAVVSGGDTRKSEHDLIRMGEDLPVYSFSVIDPEDDTRLMDLTHYCTVKNDYAMYHRLDRLSVTYQRDWGLVRLGRQAVTWGNGLLFNPMDLFNPFSPAAIDKDYKKGDDMAYGQLYTEKYGEWQFLYVPRRDSTDEKVKWAESSLAGKVHYFLKNLELNLMIAEHYRDDVAGLGIAGNLWDAAWRVDSTWTILDSDSQAKDFLTLTANMDYSWAWWEKNFYGFIEYYHCDLGSDEINDALLNQVLMTRIQRGEAFVLGKHYLAGHLNMEVHPLVNVYFTVINNLNDSSGMIQPRIIWDARQNGQITLGANFNYGASGTEFGGIEIPGRDLVIKQADSVYLWLTLYF